MSEFMKKAKEKLNENAKLDRYGSAMASSVKDALLLFCAQDDEFAQAVAQGGSWEDCMKAVAKNCGNCISDLEAFKRAVKFYFPGATVHFNMTVDVNAGEAIPEEQTSPVNAVTDMPADVEDEDEPDRDEIIEHTECEVEEPVTEEPVKKSLTFSLDDYI